MPKGFWDAKTPIAIAHRGGAAAGKDKENTLEAFGAAQRMGYEYAETDLVLAASGELVLIHGSHNWLQASFKRDITRYTLQKMTLDQIRYILRPGGTQVSTLQELVTSFPKMKFILDLKTDEAAVPLAKLIKRLKISDRVCVTGFNYARTAEVMKGCGQISCGLTVGRGLRFRNMNMLMVKTGRLNGVEAVFMHHSLVSPPMISLIHNRGFKAVVWTTNSRLGIKNAVRSGADGIISDRVGLLKDILEAKK
jgi:glycerophosphoryl diester phosphodiesterase